MYKLWPSPVLFVFAAWLFFQGCQSQEKGQKRLSDIQPLRMGDQVWTNPMERETAARDTATGRYMQIGAGVLATVGAVLFGLGMLHRHAQSQALQHRLAVKYTFVAAGPSDGSVPDASLLTEDQAAELLRTRYPTLAPGVTETLRNEFAEKRRLEPTTIWYVKDFQVSETKPT